ncbi:MAG: M24 family metallopeptidase [Thermoanaerobaculia bacterium]|nr:M24 family metallopeptidase [Thermoanaerobaculia bacterium]
MLKSLATRSVLLALVVAGFAANARGADEAPLSPAEVRRNTRIDEFLLESMRTGDLDAWIVLTREGNFDPLSSDFGFSIGRGALVFVDRQIEGSEERVERKAVVSSLDIAPLKASGIYDELIGVERDQSFEEVLAENLATWLGGLPKDLRIGINSSAGNGIADGLTASFRDLLERALGERSDRMVSSEVTVLSFRSKKLPAEIELYRDATRITREILHETMTDGFIVAGTTTQAALRDHVQEIARRRGFPETAWEPEHCPGVYSGPFEDLSHAEPGSRIIQSGDILWVDFGIRSEAYATDMIRAAYILRPGESEAPPEIAKMFATAKAANRAAVAAMKPGALGYQVDAAARSVVTAAGYPEFFHSTGHPVGFEVHGAGPALGKRGDRGGGASEMALEVGQIFAVEPSVMLPRDGGPWIVNIEEEVLITERGAEYMAPPQEELYFIPPVANPAVGVE